MKAKTKKPLIGLELEELLNLIYGFNEIIESIESFDLPGSPHCGQTCSKLNEETHWHSSDGRVTKITEMNDVHLKNAMNYCRRQGSREKYNRLRREVNRRKRNA